MHKIPDTTEERITFIAQGRLDPVEDPVGASQLLKEMFDAENYSALLHDYPLTQEYIDGLYKVYSSCFCKYLFHLASARLLMTFPLIRRWANVASGHSERR